MLTRLKGGRIYDPANGVRGEVRDLWLRDGRIVAARFTSPQNSAACLSTG